MLLGGLGRRILNKAGVQICVVGAACWSLLFSAGLARAQSLEEQGLEQQGPGGQAQGENWNLNLGLGLAVEPAYPGASDHHVRPVPLVSASCGDFFVVGPQGLRISLIDVGGFRAGPVIGFFGGRDESDDPRLNGLGNISASVTAGVFADYRAGPVDLSMTVRQAVTHTSNGMLGLVGLDYRTPILTDEFIFDAGPTIEFANGRYNQTWFGVSQTQADQSGLPVYSAGGGIKDVGLHAAVTYLYSEHIMLRLFGNIEQMTGNDANSPIVQDKTQSSIGFGAAYHF